MPDGSGGKMGNSAAEGAGNMTHKMELAGGAFLAVMGLGGLTVLELVQIWHYVAAASSFTAGTGLVIYKWRDAIRHNKRRDRRREDRDEC